MVRAAGVRASRQLQAAPNVQASWGPGAPALALPKASPPPSGRGGLTGLAVGERGLTRLAGRLGRGGG